MPDCNASTPDTLPDCSEAGRDSKRAAVAEASRFARSDTAWVPDLLQSRHPLGSGHCPPWFRYNELQGQVFDLLA